MNNKNYRVMKFLEPVNKKESCRGYVRLDIRGVRGNIIVSAENLGDSKSTSEVYLYKDKSNKIKLGDINNKKGMIKKVLTFGSNNAIEDYNVCAIVRNNKIVLFSNLFNPTTLDVIKKLESDEEDNIIIEKINDDIVNLNTNDVIKKEDVEEHKEKYEPTQEISQSVELSQTYEEQEVVENVEVEKLDSSKIMEDSFESSTPEKSVKEHEENEKEIDESSKVEAESRRYKNKYYDNLLNNLTHYKKVEPLSVTIKGFEWWYIPYDEMGMRNGFLPYYNQVISSYYPYPVSNRITTCNSLMKKYGHYIFGISNNEDGINRFIYGIPGQFTKDEQPYKGANGFKNWSYSSKGEGEHGYWLCFVNPKTGDITEPPQIVLYK